VFKDNGNYIVPWILEEDLDGKSDYPELCTFSDNPASDSDDNNDNSYDDYVHENDADFDDWGR